MRYPTLRSLRCMCAACLVLAGAPEDAHTHHDPAPAPASYREAITTTSSGGAMTVGWGMGLFVRPGGRGVGWL
jgi:hypothetical protein